MNIDDKKGSGELGSFELTKQMMQDIYDQDHKPMPTREEYAALVKKLYGGLVDMRFNRELESFLTNNALASEKDFIEYAISDAGIWIDLYQTEVDFMADPFDTDPNKRTYWFYKTYKDYLSQKLNAFTNPKSVAPTYKYTGEENWYLDIKKINELYNVCLRHEVVNKEETPYVNFLTRWDLNTTPPEPLRFNTGKQVWFVFILDNIKFINDSLALRHFGIRNYKGQRAPSRNSPNILPVFKRQIGSIFNPSTSATVIIDPF